VILLAKGKIVFDGPPRELFTQRGEELKKLGLAVPTPVAAADEIRARGVAFPDVFTREEFIEAALKLSPPQQNSGGGVENA
jgi:hypothetical protein